jgi:hypothetical protein
MPEKPEAESGPQTRSVLERVRTKKENDTVEDLLHAGVDSDQVILIEAELLRSTLGLDPSFVDGLSRIEANAIKNASMLNDIRRRLRQKELSGDF